MLEKPTPWATKILEILDSMEESHYFSLNDVAFEKLKKCRTNSQGTIYFKTIWLSLCRQFSINKRDCMKLLRYFSVIGKIEFVTGKGIRIKTD